MPTNVLILGAGASHDYDFPLAAGIIERIRKNENSLKPNAEKFGLADTYDVVVERLLRSECTSVDQFAEHLTEQRDIDTAKALIAWHLSAFEVRDAVHNRPTGHWYQTLINKLIGQTLDTFPERDIAIISFNYERSLEQCLYDSLYYRFGLIHSQAEICQAMMRLPLIHIYGRMGQLPVLAARGEIKRPYEPITSRDQMQAAISGMHILRELREDPKLGNRIAACECLQRATGKVIFLGFAYAQENLEALDLMNTRTGKTCYGTTKDLGDRGLDERADELRLRLLSFGVELAEPWLFTVHDALKYKPITVLGAHRTGLYTGVS